MIDRVHIENFKSLKDVTLELDQLTVLVGPNGCGKSSVLQALLFALHKESVEFGAWRELAASPDDDTPLVVTAMGGGYTLDFRVVFVMADSPEELPSWTLGSPDGSVADLPGAWHRSPDARRIFSVALLHAEAAKLCRPFPTMAQTELQLRPDGEGLAALLGLIAGYDADAFAAISRDLAVVVPGVSRVRVSPAQVQTVDHEVHVLDGQEVRRQVARLTSGHRFLIEFTDGRQVRSELISEGTAVALAILTLLHTPSRPNLLLIDDIDRDLHIEAQAKLVEVLRSLLQEHPDMQILCTTHSPYLLDRFKPSEVRVLALDEQRNTHARKLTEHPEFEKWKFGTQTGELWATLGDAWVTKSEPKS